MKLQDLLVTVSLLCLCFAPDLVHGELSSIVPLSETIVLTIPAEEEKNWKEITRAFDDTGGTLERIPINQSSATWSDLIFMQYTHRSRFDPERSLSVDDMLNRFRNGVYESHAKYEVTWKVLEKTKTGAIYEFLEIGARRNKPGWEHNIIRFIMTPLACHVVGFTKRNAELSNKERDTWIQVLKESVSVKPISEKITGFAVIDNQHYTVSDSDTGVTMIIPTSQMKQETDRPSAKEPSSTSK